MFRYVDFPGERVVQFDVGDNYLAGHSISAGRLAVGNDTPLNESAFDYETNVPVGLYNATSTIEEQRRSLETHSLESFLGSLGSLAGHYRVGDVADDWYETLDLIRTRLPGGAYLYEQYKYGPSSRILGVEASRFCRIGLEAIANAANVRGYFLPHIIRSKYGLRGFLNSEAYPRRALRADAKQAVKDLAKSPFGY